MNHSIKYIIAVISTIVCAGLLQGCATAESPRNKYVLVDDWYEVVNPTSTWHDQFTHRCQYSSGAIEDVGFKVCPRTSPL